jgi:heme a synthase
MEQPSPKISPALFAFASATALGTLVLVCLGGLVTSKGVGMAVPDWPTSYGYNMFLFPPSQWIGGVFDEHVHRLAASTVGLLTIILALWLQFGQAGRVLRKMGWTALGLVIFQGVLGGLRVVMDKQAVAGTTLGVVFGLGHACTGQAFFCLMATTALMLSPWWGRWKCTAGTDGPGAWAPWITTLIFIQLMLGAAMRHQHAGLAVHDFPLAYGQWWPATDAASLHQYNLHRSEEDPVTAFQILLHMAPRLGATAVAAAVLAFAASVWRRRGDGGPLGALGLFWGILILVQAALGITTVLWNKPADVATAHVAVGATALATGVFASLAAMRRTRSAEGTVKNFEEAWTSGAEAGTRGRS